MARFLDLYDVCYLCAIQPAGRFDSLDIAGRGRLGTPAKQDRPIYTRLVMQKHAEEAAVDLQLAAGAVVIDKAKLLELVHKVADP